MAPRVTGLHTRRVASEGRVHNAYTTQIMLAARGTALVSTG